MAVKALFFSLNYSFEKKKCLLEGVVNSVLSLVCYLHLNTGKEQFS